MREITSEIEINASPEDVWNELMNFSNWKDWNPIVANINGSAAHGNSLDITMAPVKEKQNHHYRAIITELNPPSTFRWRAKMMAGFLMTNDKIFELKATDSGTQLIHSETFSGMLVSMFWGKLSAHVPRMLDAMNKAFKQRVEKG